MASLMQEMLGNSYLFGSNAPFIEALYESWLKDPASVEPNTWSPGRSRVTAEPTSSTTPARSQPRIRVFGRRNPNISRAGSGCPAIRCQTPWSSPAARTRTTTSRSFTTRGFSTSPASDSFSGPPYSSWTIARTGSIVGDLHLGGHP